MIEQMNPFSWHSISLHPFGPVGYPAAVLENYTPVAWVRDGKTAESIARAAELLFERVSRLHHQRRMARRRTKRPPGSGFFDATLAQEVRAAMFTSVTPGIDPDSGEPQCGSQLPGWTLEVGRPDAPEGLDFAVVDSNDRVVAWVVSAEAARYIATAGMRAVQEVSRARRQREEQLLLESSNRQNSLRRDETEWRS